MKARRYRFPLDFKIPRIAIWDLPGYGTKTFPFNGYFENSNILLYAFDYLILICDSTLKEFDLNLLRESSQWEIPVIVLINKADNAIEGAKQKEEAKKKAVLTVGEYRRVIYDTIERIRGKVVKQIEEAQIHTTTTGPTTVWTISSLFHYKFIESRGNLYAAENDHLAVNCKVSRETAEIRVSISNADDSDTAFDKEDVLADILEGEMAEALDHIMDQAKRRRFI
jgi:Fe2+ transport system protein B